MRLKDRSRQIPGGFRYYQSETNFFPIPWSSFESCIAQIIAHRRGNAWLIDRNGWSVDPAQVASELDAFNTKVCSEMNWTDYIVAGDPGNYTAPVYTDVNPTAQAPRQLAAKCCGAK